MCIRDSGRIEGVAAAASRGDLSQRTDVTSRDETGRAARALDASLAQIGGLMTEVTGTADRVAGAVASLHDSARTVIDQAQGCLLYTPRCV